jgi:hypothetical protein
MPARDHRAARVDFVRQATRDLPEAARLYVAGLAQSAVYPYLAHPWGRCEERPEMERALRESEDRPVYLLIMHPYLGQAPLKDMNVQIVAEEPVRPKYPRPRTLALVRIRPPTSSRPAPTSGPTADPPPG